MATNTARAEAAITERQVLSRKFVKRIIVEHWHPDLDHQRLDIRVARSLKAVAKHRIRPGAPLNRVEIDTLHLPFLANSELGVVDNLHLMHAIDCETSMPLGWWLMLTKPNTEDTFACLERVLYPKTPLLKLMAINHSVDPYGTMLDLVWDNGSENSRQRMASLATIGISPIWVEVHAGHRKPFIERLNRSLKEALEALPGCTRYEGKDGARTEAARSDPLLTVKELEHWIVRWFYEKWIHMPLDRFTTADYDLAEAPGTTPAERWKYYESTVVLPLSPPRHKWRALKFVEATRKLNAKTGVSWQNFDFRGANLKTLVLNYGSGATVKLRYNDYDYRTIEVLDKNSEQWLPLINAEVTSETPAFSYDEAKKRRKAARATHKPHPAATQFDDDYLDKIKQPKSARPTHAEQRASVHTTARTQEAIKRAESRPLSAGPTPELAPDTFVASDAIPNFTVHEKTPVKRPAPR
jgi:putative transposase